MSYRDQGASSFWYFVIGTAIGAGLGLLFAPKPGEETREQLGDWLKERRKKGSELLAKIKESMPEKKEQLMATVKAGKEAVYGNGKHRHEPVA
ncbi:MAG: hypothetical protein A3J74_08785 [Elusimicrobia bacterium RIFCSPHIGHO2_02_FULL_57_9]|nr:MAG: hypothetical protein A3J74_08785 [Elusimicrobia bacterium RIFCSPHIGHO2_02_FULL_57_9]